MKILPQFAGKIYPDRSFSVGRVPREKKKKADKEYERFYKNQWDAYLDRGMKYGRVITESIVFWVGINLEEIQKMKNSSLLALSHKSSPMNKVGYGSHGITKFGRKCVKNIAILLQQRYGKNRLGFGTCTIPPTTEKIQRTINGCWGDIVRRYFQSIKRKFEKDGNIFLYTAVTEIQEKRFKSSGVPVPHLHFIYVSCDNPFNGYYLDTVSAYELWNKTVNQVLQLHGCPKIMGTGGHKGSVRLEPIKASAAAYLGKYMSKGTKVLSKMKEEGWNEFPKQWWTACMDAKKMLKESIMVMSGDFAEFLFYNLESLLHSKDIVWGNFVEIDLWEKEFKVGVFGYFSSVAYAISVLHCR